MSQGHDRLGAEQGGVIKRQRPERPVQIGIVVREAPLGPGREQERLPRHHEQVRVQAGAGRPGPDARSWLAVSQGEQRAVAAVPDHGRRGGGGAVTVNRVITSLQRPVEQGVLTMAASQRATGQPFNAIRRFEAHPAKLLLKGFGASRHDRRGRARRLAGRRPS